MLRRLIGATLPLAVLVMLASANLFAEDPDKKKLAAKDSATLVAGEYSGTVKTTPATDRKFTITVETKRLVQTSSPHYSTRLPYFYGYPTLNSHYSRLVTAQNRYVSAQQKVNSAKSNKSLQKAEATLQTAAVELVQAATAFKQTAVAAGILNTAILNHSAAKHMPHFRIDVVKQDIEFQAMEEAKVRTKVLPEQVDAKGNPRKPTKEELAEWKGKDKNLEGYESSLEKLESGQAVKVVLAAAKPKADSDKKMQAKMIVILAEADPDKGKKKKALKPLAQSLASRAA